MNEKLKDINHGLMIIKKEKKPVKKPRIATVDKYGKVIEDIMELEQLALNKKSVIYHSSIIAASIVCNWQFGYLLNQIRNKRLTVYNN